MKPPVNAPTFLHRHRAKLGVGLVVAVVLALFLTNHSSSKHSDNSASPITLLAPLPPPPPPPKLPPPPKKMVDQTPVDRPEPKPETPQNSPKPAPAPAGVNTLGKGPSSFHLGGGSGSGEGGGSKWGWYASAVQNAIGQALRENASTHHAGFGVTARIWSDVTGKVTRAELVTSTGNPSLDDAIQNQVLTGLVLPEPPPAGMPMPINMRINARP